MDREDRIYIAGIESSPAEAIRLKSQIAALVIFTLEPPYFSKGVGGSSPTITGPVDLDVISLRIHARLSRVWVYNRTTGEIYTELKLGDE